MNRLKQQLNIRLNKLAQLASLVLVLVIVALIVISNNTAQASFNEQINYQGKLMTSSSAAVTDGTYHMRFKLCTDVNCASSVFDETWTSSDKITVTSGLFSVLLGSVSTTAMSTIDFNQDLYLQVMVGGSGVTPTWETLSPAKRLGAVPNAFNANKLGGLASSSFLRSDALNVLGIFTDISSTNISSSQATSTNLFASIFNAIDATISNIINIATAIITNLTATTANITNLVFGNATGTSMTLGSLTATSSATLATTTISGELTLGSLSGLLQANSGVISTTSTISNNYLNTNVMLEGDNISLLVNDSDYLTTYNSSTALAVFSSVSTTALQVNGNATTTGNLSIGTTLSAGTSTLTNLIVTNLTTSTFAGGLTVGTSQFVVQQSTGYVGIGMSSPNTALNVSSSIALTRPGYNPEQIAAVEIGPHAPNNTIAPSGGGGSSLFINTPGYNIFSSGLGIDGTFSSPTSLIRLHAYGVKSAGYYSDMAFYTTNGTSETEVMRLDRNGYVGIGTTTPGSALVVAGSIVDTGQITNIGNLRNTADGTSDINLIFGNYPAAGQYEQLYWDASASNFDFTDDVLVEGNATTTGYLTVGTAPTGANYGVGDLNIASQLVAPYVSSTVLTVSGNSYLGTTTITNLSVTNLTTSTFAGGLTVGSTDLVVQQATGNVGIGITPATRLDIDTGSNTSGLRVRGLAETAEIGDIYMGSGGQMVISTANTADTTSYIEIDPEDNEYGLILRDGSTGSSVYSNLFMNNATVDYLNININATNATAGLVVTDNDYVGIGTTTPAQKLDVYGNASFGTGGADVNSSISFQNNGTNMWTMGNYGTDDTFVLASGGTIDGTNDILKVKSGDGKILIGETDYTLTTVSTAKFYVASSTNNVASIKMVNDSTGASAIAGISAHTSSTNNTTNIQVIAYGSEFTQTHSVNYPNAGTVVTGNGMTNGLSVGAFGGDLRLFTSNSGLGNTPYVRMRIASTTGNILIASNITATTPASTTSRFIVSNDAGSWGAVNTSTGAWMNSSDIRLKKNVIDLEDSLTKVMNLRPVRFDWNWENNSSNGNSIGFIAQEMQTVLPEFVDEGLGGYLGISYSALTPVLAGAIKQQQVQIDLLKSQLSSSTSLTVSQPESPQSTIAVTDQDPYFNTLRVAGATTFYGTITIIGEAGFESRVVFKKDVEIEGKLYLDKDQAGTVMILAGATSTVVNFDLPYQSIPKIVANLKGSSTPVFMQYLIVDQATSTFKIILEQPAPMDLYFDWIALGVRGQVAGVQAIAGCTDSTALNYNDLATESDGSCAYETVAPFVPQSTEPLPAESQLDVSPSETPPATMLTEEPAPPAPVPGCMDSAAANYDPLATQDNGACAYEPVAPVEPPPIEPVPTESTPIEPPPI